MLTMTRVFTNAPQLTPTNLILQLLCVWCVVSTSTCSTDMQAGLQLPARLTHNAYENETMAFLLFASQSTALQCLQQPCSQGHLGFCLARGAWRARLGRRDHRAVQQRRGRHWAAACKRQHTLVQGGLHGDAHHAGGVTERQRRAGSAVHSGLISADGGVECCTVGGPRSRQPVVFGGVENNVVQCNLWRVQAMLAPRSSP